MKVGIFGSQYQQEKQSIIRRVFSKLTSLEAEIYVDTLFTTICWMLLDLSHQ